MILKKDSVFISFKNEGLICCNFSGTWTFSKKNTILLKMGKRKWHEEAISLSDSIKVTVLDETSYPYSYESILINDTISIGLDEEGSVVLSKRKIPAGMALLHG